MQLSSHDNGWEGFPLDRNPYAAQGSRCLFGYSFLLTPAIPLFMAGEEFDAGYRPLPNLTPGLYGSGEPGTGRWLYGSWLQWEQLSQPAHAAMLEDVQRLIQIRRSHLELIRPLRTGEEAGHLLPVPLTAGADLPIPYLYGQEGRALLVAGNPHRDRDVALRFQLPLAAMGWSPDRQIRVKDLWTGLEPLSCTARAFGDRSFTISRDGAQRGGLLILSLGEAVEV